MFFVQPPIVPSGSIILYAGNNIPETYFLCDGSAVSRTLYPILFTAIGTLYGVGDGSTTFNLPNLKQKFPLGKADNGTGSTLGEVGGSIDHTHTADPPNTTTSVPSALGSGLTVGITQNDAYQHTHDVNIPSFNTGSNNPPYITLNYIIKV